MTHAFRSVTNGTVRLKMRGENQTAESLDLHISVAAQPVATHDHTFLSTLSEPLKSGRKFDSRWLGLYLCVLLVERLKGSCGTDFEGSTCTGEGEATASETTRRASLTGSATATQIRH